MAVSSDVVAYHRSFLSKYYFDNFNPPNDSERRQRTIAEIEEIRQRDPQGFEEARRALAFMLKVPYKAGYTIPAARGDQGGPSSPRWVTGIPSDAQVGDCMAPLNPSQITQISPETGYAAIPMVQFSWKAYINSTELYETRVFQKMDQIFEEYATPFERDFSSLCVRTVREDRFTPILDNHYAVIGHTGKLQGGPAEKDSNYATFMIPENCADQCHYLSEAFEMDIPVFVKIPKHASPGWVVMHGYTCEDSIEVRTTIDGEITDFKQRTIGGLITPWYDPMDFIAVGKVLVNMGSKLGTKLAKTLIRRATSKLEARAVLEGATKRLAKDAESDLARRAAQHPKPPAAGAGSNAVKEAEADLARRNAQHPKPPGRGGGGAGGGGGGAGRTVVESELREFPHNRNYIPTRISRQEMANLVRQAIAKRPYLRRLAAAGQSNAPADAVMRILNEWAEATGKTFMKVTNGTVKRLKSMGGGGWAIDPLTGREVLILDESLFQNPKKFVDEVAHELAYEASRTPGGMPAIAPGVHYESAMEWVENVILYGEDRAFTLLLGE